MIVRKLWLRGFEVIFRTYLAVFASRLKQIICVSTINANKLYIVEFVDESEFNDRKY